jgi:transcriptional regulator
MKRSGGPRNDSSVDAALAVLCALFPGRALKQRVIAQVTGLSQAGVDSIEQRALRKLRAALNRELHHV